MSTAEERAAWVAFAAIRFGATVDADEEGAAGFISTPQDAASSADKMLTEYRKRFAVEVELRRKGEGTP